MVCMNVLFEKCVCVCVCVCRLRVGCEKVLTWHKYDALRMHT
jgi:hypothetical protein